MPCHNGCFTWLCLILIEGLLSLGEGMHSTNLLDVHSDCLKCPLLALHIISDGDYMPNLIENC